MSKAVMQQALTALELARDYAEGERLENERRYRGHEHLAPDDAYAVGQIDNAITALRAALADQERGPGWCPIHQHYKPCEHNTAEQSQPVAWAYECRLSLVTALYSLASDFENALYKFDGHDEALHSANGSIAHARKVAAQWGWNGAAPPAPQPLTELPPMPEPAGTLVPPAMNEGKQYAHGYTADQMRDYARAVEAEVLKRMGVGK